MPAGRSYTYQPSVESYRPSTSGSGSGRIPSAETATSLWSEDGAETVLPGADGMKGKYEYDARRLHEDEDENGEDDADMEMEGTAEGDLIQLYSDGERPRPRILPRSYRRTNQTGPETRRVQGQGQEGQDTSNESLLDSQAEFSGLREEDLHQGQGELDDVEEDDLSASAPDHEGAPRAAVAPAPTPGDKLRQLLAQMNAQSALASTTARAASPVKRSTALPEMGRRATGAKAAGGDRYTRPAFESMRVSTSASVSASGTGPGYGATYMHTHTHSQAGPSSPPLNVRKANWREGRRIGVYPPQSPPRTTTARREGGSARGIGPVGVNEDGDEDDDSPPTPPMRITNPFVMSARWREQSAAAPAAAEIEERHQWSRSPQHLKRSLEQYISHHPSIPPPLDPSSSRSGSGSDHLSSSSRKGKERAIDSLTPSGPQASIPRRSIRSQGDDASPPDTRESRLSPAHARHAPSQGPTYQADREQRTPRADRHRHHPPTSTRDPKSRASRASAGARGQPTPRKSSVDLAPDDSALFAQEAEGLEVLRHTVELDLDEDEEDGIGERGLPWEGPSDDAVELEEDQDRGPETGHEGGRSGSVKDNEVPDRSSQEISAGRDDSGRLSRLLRRTQAQGRQEPEPDLDPNPENGSRDGPGGQVRESPSRLGQSRSMPAARSSLSASMSKNSSFTTAAASPIRVHLVSVPDPMIPPNALGGPGSPARAPHASSSTGPGPGPVPKAQVQTQTPLRNGAGALGGSRQPYGPNFSTMATPHPPGWLANTPVSKSKTVTAAGAGIPASHLQSQPSPARAVRFSPLRKTDADWSATDSSLRTGTTVDGASLRDSHRQGPPLGQAQGAEGEEEGEGASLHTIHVKVSPRSKRAAYTKGTSRFSPGQNGPGSLARRATSSSPLAVRSLKGGDRDGFAIKPDAEAGADASMQVDPDSSITARLLGPLTRLLPPRSSTYTAAAPLIAAAEHETVKAREKVQESQRLWMDAVAALQALEGRARQAVGSVRLDGQVVKGAVREGWRWGTWGWWVAMEVLLMWAVFRITIEYASPSMLNSLFMPDLSARTALASGSANPFGLAVPLPSGLSAFVVRQSRFGPFGFGSGSGSVNFFDLLERADFWLTGLAASRMEGVSRGWEPGWGVGAAGGVPA